MSLEPALAQSTLQPLASRRHFHCSETSLVLTASGGNAALPTIPRPAPSEPGPLEGVVGDFLSLFFSSFGLTVLAIVGQIMLKALALTCPGGLLGTATMLGAMLEQHPVR